MYIFEECYVLYMICMGTLSQILFISQCKPKSFLSPKQNLKYCKDAGISITGQHQCLVQLSTMPLAVCHGTGETVDDAHAQAAHNALQYLRLMVKT